MTGDVIGHVYHTEMIPPLGVSDFSAVSEKFSHFTAVIMISLFYGRLLSFQLKTRCYQLTKRLVGKKGVYLV